MTRGRFLKKIAREILGEDKASLIWGRIEIIGDIAVIRIPFELEPEELKPLAERILEEFKYIRSVWGGLPGVSGPYRLRPYVHLAGEKRSETIYREHGCLFKVDITRVYVSPTLNYEHRRIARLVRPGEVITNMFAGAGFFSIIAAKLSRPRKVYSIDVNPDAYRFMVENVRLNKVEGIVEPILGDAAQVIMEKLQSSSDRVLMPYPELALDYLRYAIMAIRNCGWVHVYLHIEADKGENPYEKAKNMVADALSELVKKYGFGTIRKVRTVKPRTYQIAVDVFIEK